MSDNKKFEVEIESLNLDTLDVTELEHRLEMAMAGPTTPDGDCYIDNSCTIDVVIEPDPT